jgi:hypothetical protein
VDQRDRGSLAEQLRVLIKRKDDIDARNKTAGTRTVSHEFWLADAVELLLRIELAVMEQ